MLVHHTNESPVSSRPQNDVEGDRRVGGRWRADAFKTGREIFKSETVTDWANKG